MKLKFREPMSGFTHFVGIIFGVFVLMALLTRPTGSLTVWHAVSFSVFGSGMILLYTFSTLYHLLPLSGKNLEVFRKIDHIMIFVFIAATYTPICLITMRGVWGWSIFGTVWGLALAGFFLKIFWLNAPRFLYTSVYLLMGWIILIAIWPLSRMMVTPGIFWLFFGGVSYSVGAMVYAIKKPDPWPDFFGFHEIFHLFILMGSFSHFWMIYHYV